MADYIRRLVSGSKARFKDGNLKLELDLVYVTDQVIIMGYPAQGIEGLYRNRREDAKRFLEHRHGKNFWVFNFCPVVENSYDPNFFDGRVSRYPFPDHHAPPLAILPLVAREMREWLNGSPDRVAVLHCKAGKGRSGTLACAYLLSLDEGPTPPRLERSYTAKQWAKIRAEEMMTVIPEDDSNETTEETLKILTLPSTIDDTNAYRLSDPPTSASSDSISAPQPTVNLNTILDLHTQRRMRAPSSPSSKPKQGVSIPSQRRWLYYWSLILAHEAPIYMARPPSPFAGLSPCAPTSTSRAQIAYPHPQVCLTQIRLRMKESSASGLKMGLVRAANLVIARTGKGAHVVPGVANKNGRGHGYVWASLARYDDELVGMLEGLETETRAKDSGVRMGSEVFAGKKWDSGKMVRSFARMGMVGEGKVGSSGPDKNGKEGEMLITYILRPLSDSNWVHIRDELKQGAPDTIPTEAPSSEANSMYEVPLDNTTITNTVKGAPGVVLDAGREVRVKLYLGQVFMGWLWFIPAFHMSPPPLPLLPSPASFVLTRKEVDFPLGIGSGIVDVGLTLEWVVDTESGMGATVTKPPRKRSGESEEPAGISLVAAAQVVSSSVADAVEVKQALED